jgi:hypothetical protein
MSKVIANNATELATSGLSIDNFDILRMKEIVLRHATTKTGGFNFQAGVLFTKVCKEIKSLCGMHNKSRLPDGIAKSIMSEIEALPKQALETLKEQGYVHTRQSGAKVRVNFRDLQVKRAVVQTYEKIGSLEEQCKDLHWMIVSAQSAISKLNAVQPKDLEHRQAIETKVASLEENILKYQRLEKILKMELAEQKKLVESQAA